MQIGDTAECNSALRLQDARLVLFVTAVLAANCFAAEPASKQCPEFSSWPKGSSPQEIGKRVAERFVASPHGKFGRTNPPTHITYPETCAWYGALTFAKVSGDTNLTARLIQRFDPLFTTEAKLVPKPSNVDSTVFGSVPLEIYLQTGDKKYLELGKTLRRQTMGNARRRQIEFQRDRLGRTRPELGDPLLDR